MTRRSENTDEVTPRLPLPRPLRVGKKLYGNQTLGLDASQVWAPILGQVGGEKRGMRSFCERNERRREMGTVWRGAVCDRSL